MGASLEYSSTDTVIAPLDQDGLEDILKTGAVVLDLTDGLMPLELTEEPGEIPEVPDVPDVLPDPPTAEAPEPTTVEETTEQAQAGTEITKEASRGSIARTSQTS